MAETKEIITAAAQKLFARFGLYKTTVDEIARIAHVGKGTIYQYFQSKDEIFEEVIKREEWIFKDEIRKNVDAAATPQEKLKVYVITRFWCLKEFANYNNALKDYNLSHYQFIENAQKENIKDELKLVIKILDEGNQNKVFAISDIKSTALAIVTALKALEYTWTFESPLRDIEKSIEILLNILFIGIETR
jgi:AcrR family transcriptional regulator